MPPYRISRFGFVNCYLVEEEDGLTLVDTMIGGSAKTILAAAERAGRLAAMDAAIAKAS